MVPPAAAGLTYGDLIAEAFDRYAGREAFVDGDRRVTYAEAGDLTGRIQQVLLSRGLRAGGAVGGRFIHATRLPQPPRNREAASWAAARSGARTDAEE